MGVRVRLFEAIKIGDVVIYKNSSDAFVKRIDSITDDALTVSGDSTSSVPSFRLGAVSKNQVSAVASLVLGSYQDGKLKINLRNIQ